jgi:hypothetical protein
MNRFQLPKCPRRLRRRHRSSRRSLLKNHRARGRRHYHQLQKILRNRTAHHHEDFDPSFPNFLKEHSRHRRCRRFLHFRRCHQKN